MYDSTLCAQVYVLYSVSYNTFYRISFLTEEETLSAIKSPSSGLFPEYHKDHLESMILDETDDQKDPCSPLSLESKLVPEFQIKSVSVSPIVKKFKGKIALTLCDLHKIINELSNKLDRNSHIKELN